MLTMPTPLTIREDYGIYLNGPPRFEWDEHNTSHIRRHEVTQAEAEEALTDPHLVDMPTYSTRYERRWAVLGATRQGRILFVVYTRREDRVRVVTARDASRQERRLYNGGKQG